MQIQTSEGAATRNRDAKGGNNLSCGCGQNNQRKQALGEHPLVGGQRGLLSTGGRRGVGREEGALAGGHIVIALKRSGTFKDGMVHRVRHNQEIQ